MNGLINIPSDLAVTVRFDKDSTNDVLLTLGIILAGLIVLWAIAAKIVRG